MTEKIRKKRHTKNYGVLEESRFISQKHTHTHTHKMYNIGFSTFGIYLLNVAVKQQNL